MSEPGPGAGGVIAGIFIVLFGLCLLLVGGSCTVMFVWAMGSTYGGAPYEAMPLFLISLVTLGAGISLIWLGVKLMTGGFNKPPPG